MILLSRLKSEAVFVVFTSAMGIFGLCCIAAYLHFLRAKTP